MSIVKALKFGGAAAASAVATAYYAKTGKDAKDFVAGSGGAVGTVLNAVATGMELAEVGMERGAHLSMSATATAVGHASAVAGGVVTMALGVKQIHSACKDEIEEENKIWGSIAIASGALSSAGGVISLTGVGLPVGTALIIAGGAISLTVTAVEYAWMKSIKYAWRLFNLNHKATIEQIDAAYQTALQTVTVPSVRPINEDDRADQIWLLRRVYQREAIIICYRTLTERAQKYKRESANAVMSGSEGVGDCKSEPELKQRRSPNDQQNVIECQRYWVCSGWTHSLFDARITTPYFIPDEFNLPETENGFDLLDFSSRRVVIDNTTDADGWQYAVNNWRRHDWTVQPTKMSFVRRRVWRLV